MSEKQPANDSKWVGIAGLLVPPITLSVMVNLTDVSETAGLILLWLTIFCFVAPILVGFFLFYKFAKTISYVSLILAILNIFSPVWLFFFLAFMVFKDAKDF